MKLLFCILEMNKSINPSEMAFDNQMHLPVPKKHIHHNTHPYIENTIIQHSQYQREHLKSTPAQSKRSMNTIYFVYNLSQEGTSRDMPTSRTQISQHTHHTRNNNTREKMKGKFAFNKTVFFFKKNWILIKCLNKYRFSISFNC